MSERKIRCRQCKANAEIVGTATYSNRLYGICRCENGHEWRMLVAASPKKQERPAEAAKKAKKAAAQARRDAIMRKIS